MTRDDPRLPRAGVLAALVGGLVLSHLAWAAEIHFVAEDLGNKGAAWVPTEVTLHKSTELQDGLMFILENPTDRTHAFAAYGLFQQAIGANGEPLRKPLRVNVTPGDTVQVRVSTEQFGMGGQAEGAAEEFPFFCPLHKGDAHLGGVIRIVP
jgi:hypothetical protein